MIILVNYLNNFYYCYYILKMIIKICSDDKIYNPKTGRCVLKSGIIGQRLLKESKIDELIIGKINEMISNNKKIDKINIGILYEINQINKIIESSFNIITSGCSMFNKNYKIMFEIKDKKFSFGIIFYEVNNYMTIALFNTEKEANKYYYNDK